jgi:ribonuclease HII
MKILGIDEAGRGAVLGPLVVAGFLNTEQSLTLFSGLRLKSSKLLTPNQRTRLAEELLGLALECEIVKITPAEINKASLNFLTAQKSAYLINLLKPNKALLDAPARGKGVLYYQQKVKKMACSRTKVLAFNKADETEPLVAAASIIAKITRDAEIKALHKEFGDFGSGYPSDPKTKKFLQDCYVKYKNFPPDLVRLKWQTIKNIIEVRPP